MIVPSGWVRSVWCRSQNEWHIEPNVVTVLSELERVGGSGSEGPCRFVWAVRMTYWQGRPPVKRQSLNQVRPPVGSDYTLSVTDVNLHQANNRIITSPWTVPTTALLRENVESPRAGLCSLAAVPRSGQDCWAPETYCTGWLSIRGYTWSIKPNYTNNRGDALYNLTLQSLLAQAR